jgi:hypothetical protein
MVAGSGTGAPADEITYEPFDDGWPQYEEPFMTVN